MRRKLISLILVFSIILPMCAVFTPKVFATENVIFQDDFESYPVGSFPPPSSGWQIVWNGAGDQYQVITDSYCHSPTKSLQLMGSYGWSVVVKKDFSSSSNIIGYEAYLMAPPGGGGSVAFCNIPIETWGRYYAMVGFGADGYIWACEKNNENTHKLQPFTPYTWYKIRVVVDRSAKVYNVWIDDALKGQSIPIYYDPWEILSLQFQVGWVNANGYFDDVKVFEVSGPFISSVSPITATRLQAIYIHGSGFGDTQPQNVSAWDGDGSVDTVVTGTTPVLGIGNNGIAPDAWAAGVENASNGVHCAIGLYLVSWSDTEIVLGGFGSALNTNGQGPWNIAVGDPLDVYVWTPSGDAHYEINVTSGPVISSVSTITATRLQTITIIGAGFGNTQPQNVSLGDGSVDTVNSSITPSLDILDHDKWGSGWIANGVSCAIGLILESWSDNEIVLGGFGTALGTNGWNISPGDLMIVTVHTPSGYGNYSLFVSAHDVAVTNIVAIVPHCSSKVGNDSWVFQGRPVYVNVTVLNKGDFDENVTVTLYYNITADQIVGAQDIIALSPGQNETVAFVWDTTSVPYCQNYTLTAVATIPLDNNPADNTLACGPINVRIMGDINGNGKVDGKDIALASLAFGTVPGDPRWNLDSDTNGDNKIDGRDITLTALNFGKA